jgi:hypothetical protein
MTLDEQNAVPIYCRSVDAPDQQLVIHASAPARVTAVAIMAAALVLVGSALTRGSTAADADSPIAPVWIAVLTLAVATVLARRAWTQVAVLDRDGIRTRNVTSTVRVPWQSVEELSVLRGTGVRAVEVQVRGLRRSVRLGAATRWSGPLAEAVTAQLRSHPRAGALLRVDEP